MSTTTTTPDPTPSKNPLIADGEALALQGVQALKTALDTFFQAGEAAVPKITSDLIPTVVASLENIVPKSALPWAQVLLGVAEPAAQAAVGPLTADVVSALKVASGNVDGLLARITTSIGK